MVEYAAVIGGRARLLYWNLVQKTRAYLKTGGSMSRQTNVSFGFVSLLLSSCWFLTASDPAFAGDLDKAPPPFAYRDGMAVPIDMETVEIHILFDASTSKATGRAHVVFHTGDMGMPILDLVPTPTAIRVDGEEVALNDFAAVEPPGRETRFRILAVSLSAHATHELDIEYPIPDVTFSDGRVRAGFFMNDLALGGRRFFEQYGPANLEFDQVRYTFHVDVVGTTRAHEIFTNGELTSEGPNHWTVEFPEYFTTSSIFFHLSDSGRFSVLRYTFDSVGGDIPVTVYSANSNLTQSVANQSRTILRNLEQLYGAFVHPRVIIYATSDGGGMEHCGATMTSSSALSHELAHSFFARGVMPANGNAGWIDEAVTSWRDRGFPTAQEAPNRNPINLGGFSDYRRHTPEIAYTSGMQLISEFDFMFRGVGGMRGVLRQMFSEQRLMTITVPMFQAFLERASGQDLGAIFNRYVYGKRGFESKIPAMPSMFGSRLGASDHPRPYTAAELALYR